MVLFLHRGNNIIIIKLSMFIFYKYYIKNFLKYQLERLVGFEPTLSPWQGDVLPLYDNHLQNRRTHFSELLQMRREPPSHTCFI